MGNESVFANACWLIGCSFQTITFGVALRAFVQFMVGTWSAGSVKTVNDAAVIQSFMYGRTRVLHVAFMCFRCRRDTHIKRRIIRPSSGDATKQKRKKTNFWVDAADDSRRVECSLWVLGALIVFITNCFCTFLAAICWRTSFDAKRSQVVDCLFDFSRGQRKNASVWLESYYACELAQLTYNLGMLCRTKWRKLQRITLNIVASK